MFETGFISVIVPLKLEWEPVYALGGAVKEFCTTHGKESRDVAVGDRVRLRFAGKEYVAVVSRVNVNPTTAPDKVKTVEEVLDWPAVGMEEIELWRQIASYYMCSIGEVYKMAYPSMKMIASGMSRNAKAELRAQRDYEKHLLRIGRIKERIERREEQLRRAKKESVIERLKAEIAELNGQLSSLSDAEIAGNGEKLASGSENAEAQSYGATERFEDLDTLVLSPSQLEAYGKIEEAFQAGKPALLQGITGSGKTEIYTKLAQEAIYSGKNVLYLVPEIALSRQLEERMNRYFPGELMCYHSGLTAAERQNVMSTVSGHGKTCGNKNTAYILLGTRSALFLPHHDLGLVIVDEEHDSSYKQDSPAPRYNGRDVALMLAAEHHCNILLGSATPSFESLYNCACGRFRQIFLNERFHGDGNTETIIIDTNAERKKRGMVGSISRKLIEILKSTLESGGQAMVLRARKSYATTVQCSECGAIIRCPHCNVSLNLQKSRGRLVCNHCGYTTAWSEHIPHPRPNMPDASGLGHAQVLNGNGAGQTAQRMCNGRLIAFGAGTEKIEEELKAIFPERTVARLDSDTSAKTGWQKKVLKDFADRKIDILLGTQMLTKGFDFDNLSLVAVLQADSLLGQQDFRADEKAVQLLEQFRGRCSRRGQEGTFVIQTAQPEHPVYQMLKSEDSAAAGAGSWSVPPKASLMSAGDKSGQLPAPLTAAEYKTGLLEERRAFHYPPYTRIINLIIKDGKPERLERLSSTLSLILRGSGTFPGQGVEVTPPFAPAVDKLRDEYIRIIRISLPKDRYLSANKSALSKAIDSFAAERKYDAHITVDVDPS